MKKVKLTSDAPSTTAVCNSPSDATLQSSARQVADYEGSPLVIVLDSDCEVNEAAICIQSSAMPTIQSRADFEPGVSFSQSHTAKTWLRSTMTEDRLNGLCMISVHREKISTSKQQFIERVVTQVPKSKQVYLHVCTDAILCICRIHLFSLCVENLATLLQSSCKRGSMAHHWCRFDKYIMTASCLLSTWPEATALPR